MGKFILYTVAGTLATFAIIVHFSLMPHLMQMPGFREGVTAHAIFAEYRSFLLTFAISWVCWWSISGILSLLVYSMGRYMWFILFAASLTFVFIITLLIT